MRGPRAPGAWARQTRTPGGGGGARPPRLQSVS
ncbi:hypothetical protein ABIC61_003420 [Curtobacterium sp. 1544]